MTAQGILYGVWVVIADGEKALYLVNQGDEYKINLAVRRKKELENPKPPRPLP